LALSSLRIRLRYSLFARTCTGEEKGFFQFTAAFLMTDTCGRESSLIFFLFLMAGELYFGTNRLRSYLYRDVQEMMPNLIRFKSFNKDDISIYIGRSTSTRHARYLLMMPTTLLKALIGKNNFLTLYVKLIDVGGMKRRKQRLWLCFNNLLTALLKTRDK
jgi:hypothetical protein